MKKNRILIAIGILGIFLFSAFLIGWKSHVLTSRFETYEKMMKESKEKLLSTKVVCWYQSITDYKAFNRTIDDVITHLKETNTDFIFRAFWKYKVIPETCSELPLNQRKICEKAGYSYENFKKSISEIKKEIPSIIISAGIPTERIDVNEYNPITGKKYTKTELWEMALDPAKWNIINPKTGKPLTKEEFQFNRGKLLGFFPSDWTSPSDYNWREAYAYYPDITNLEFQKLQLSWAKKMIDSGADAIWIDMLFAQARMFYELTKDPYHPAVKEAYEAALKQIDEIHKYAKEKGKYVYVGGWTNFLEIRDGKGNPAYPMPDFDFVVNMIWEEEVKNKNLSEERWDIFFAKIKKYLGNNTLILVFMDEAAVRWQDQPLGIFSQYLNKTEQAKFLETADSFFSRKREEFKLPITFVYPLHGGWIGTNAEVLSFGKFKVYDSLAPEFETYETIKELAQKKKPEPVFPDWINEPLFEMIQFSKEGILTFKEQEKMLPLLAEMGIKTVYLTPIWEICENPGGLKRYCIKDYYKIDPEKGTEEDLKEFVEKAHSYGMKVILDLVTAHTGPGRYIYENHKDWVLKDKYGRLALCWPHKHWGYAVDRKNPEVIEHFTKIAKYYVDKFGIDGWRVDAIGTMYCNESIPNCPQPVEGEHHSKDLLKSIKSALGKDKALYLEWCYLGRLYLFNVGVEEEEGCPYPNPIPCSMALPELNEYADACYSYEFGKCFMKKILAGKITSKDFVEFFKKECLYYGKPRGRFLMTHDFGYHFYEKNPKLHKLGAVLITTIPGFPHIYHREIFSEGDVNSINQEIFNLYKKLLKIREEYKAIKEGEIENVWKGGDNVIAYLRKYEDEKVVVVVNFQNRSVKAFLKIPFEKNKILYDLLNNQQFLIDDPDNFAITLAPYEARILVKLKRLDQ